MLTGLGEQLELFVRGALAGNLGLPEVERELRKRFLLGKLQQYKGNQCKAAHALGMHRNTLLRNLGELGITRAVRAELFSPKKQARRAVTAGGQERMG